MRVSFPVGKVPLESERVTRENRDTAGGGDNLIRVRSAWEGKRYGFGFLTHGKGVNYRVIVARCVCEGKGE